MTKQTKRILSIVLSLILVFGTVPVTALATETAPAESINFGHREIDYTAPVVHIPSNNRGDSSIPSSYDLRNDITLPPVRNQNPYGACWAHATIAALEIAMIKNGMADETVDLSELQLVNSSYTASRDPLGNLDGDDTVISGNNPLDIGGNAFCASKVLNRWSAGADENVMKYAEDAAFVRDGGEFTDDFYYGLNEVRLSEYYILNKENLNEIKRMIIRYGCGVTAFFHDESFVNNTTGAIFSNKYDTTNHEIAVVGWDDNYSRENFSSSAKPLNDGAWLIRNSWGKRGGQNGYYWISYEDTSIDSEWSFFNVKPADAYDRNYQYDGNFSIADTPTPNGVANIYTAVSHEYIKAVNLNFEYNTNALCEFRVYKNPSSDKTFVKNDTPVYQGTFTTTYPGIYTTELKTPVEVNEGDEFAVYYKILSCDEDEGYYSCAVTTDWGWANNIEEVSGRSYYISQNGYSTALDADFRIKAFTVSADIDTPDNFTSSLSGSEVTLSWNAVDGADAYEVWSSIDNKAYAQAVKTQGTSVTLTADSSEGILHKYKVRAVKGENSSDFSQGEAVRFTKKAGIGSISLDDEIQVAVGQTIKLDAVITPDNASDRMISYTAENSDIADLTSDGYLTAKAVGTLTVSAMSRDGAFKAQTVVTIVGETEHTPLPAVTENEKAATCTQKGSYDSVIYCSGCGEEISRETIETEIASHSLYVSAEAVPATCSKTGKTEEISCSVCKQVITPSQISEATGKHNFTWVTDKVATCGESGLKHEECSVCQTVRSDNTVIEATGKHSYTAKTVSESTKKSDADCKRAAEYYYSCSVCGKVEKNSSHTFTSGAPKAHECEWKTVIQPTCGKEGRKDYICKNCGTSQSSQPVAATGNHTPDVVDGVAPTCTKEGHSDYIVCTVCSKKLSEPKVLAPTGHNYVGGTCEGCGAHCDHICHSTGFSAFIYKIMLFFWKIFKSNPVCECGVRHN